MTTRPGDPSSQLHDLLDLATWEDFGLTQAVDAFLRKLDEPVADRALVILARSIAELRAHDLASALSSARRLRQAVLAAADAFDADDAPEEPIQRWK